MTLKEKIAQMFVFGFRGAFPEDVTPLLDQLCRYNPGGVWLTDGFADEDKATGNIISPEQLRKLIQHLQQAAPLPLFITIDAEGGAIIRLKEAYGFPATLSAWELGRQNNITETYRHYSRLAVTLRQTGINFNFAPVVDVNLRPENPALGAKGRCFSDNAAMVTVHARAAVDAMHHKGILTCLKHFPGHGNVAEDSHVGPVDISRSWSETELLPYRTLINEGYGDAVLIAHVCHEKFDARHPATLSPSFVRYIREKLAFTGLLISDDLNMGAIRDVYDYREALTRAVNAGLDILLHSNRKPYDPELIGKSISLLHEQVQKGAIQKERIEEAWRRIQSCKKKWLKTYAWR
ncbi:MAG: glycoside hydrolase family 3 protein [Calditrichaeota bacterium]|nr:MAG: glycoside hydrolase family 3 protein [Calditrichota bacterium]